ncbi:hypothetical protein [Candidatus Solirubrobacter pratensis]|uniref:hypothetical protein n=1 Tax=Candidatus Solirubrobacter pratensis TaxID=1298857 RepID=UPI001E5C154F|nr:hypothetical protein [Candidatus Solirubrobacter pratensis]
MTGIELDDLLDTHPTQGQIVEALRDALDQGTPPAEIVERRNAYRALRQVQPECRCCGRPGDSTRHHYVNRWMMRELSNYVQVAARSRCTIPVCIDCHRDLHDRDNTVSIVGYLTQEERANARRLLEQLRREHPKIIELLAEGDDQVYEARLVKDWLEGRFDQ